MVVVVSAMARVTNKLIAAASCAEAGDGNAAMELLGQIRQQHDSALVTLIESVELRKHTSRKMNALFEEGEQLCQSASLSRELTLREKDAIASLGERLSVLLVAAALKECAVASEAVDPTELVVTDSFHGAANPNMDLTRRCCEARLLPLLEQEVVPVCAGFVGATTDGVLTTLGRGGSDYSATIIGAALEADEVVIWTDVDGLMTADPRLVTDVRTIHEVSYREAGELAYFGAKVLHAKTFRPLLRQGIPLWVRNTFAPEKAGTKMTPDCMRSESNVTALAATGDAALITIRGQELAEASDWLGRAAATARELHADVLAIWQGSSQGEICAIVSASVANRFVEELRREFADELASRSVESIGVDAAVALVTVVGNKLHETFTLGRACSAFHNRKLNVLAIAPGSLDCSISFVVAKEGVQRAMIALHDEFHLAGIGAQEFRDQSFPQQSWNFDETNTPFSAAAD